MRTWAQISIVLQSVRRDLATFEHYRDVAIARQNAVDRAFWDGEIADAEADIAKLKEEMGIAEQRCDAAREKWAESTGM